MKTHRILLSLVAATLFPAAASLEAQSPVPPVRAQAPAARGWIGVEFTLHEILSRTPSSEPRERLGILVQNVMAGGPAAAAGLRPGDWIVGVDGRPATWEVLTGRLDVIRPGERLEFRVDRGAGGAPQVIPIQVAERPAAILQRNAIVMSFDSLRQRMLVSIDSIRTEVIRLQAANVEPLEYVIEGRTVVRDGVLTPLRPPGAAPNVSTEARLLPQPQQGRTMTVIFSGHRAVAGAELTPLGSNPELARYFGTDGGLLVVEVMEGTPAERAGLKGGDVVREVNGERVSEVEEFRRALEAGYRSPPVTVAVIRDRNRVTLRFTR